MTNINIILLITAILTALMAGLFFSYSFSVVLGLGRLDNFEYINAMQSINREIKNPIFFIVFFGTLLLLPITSFLHYQQTFSTKFLFILASTIFYVIGVFGVTVLGNIPLNEKLDKFNLQSSSSEIIKTERDNFEYRWNKLNLIRTISSTISIILIISACIFSDNKINALD
ncbi:MAG: anthrone oxygenase family protein [Cyanobacteriota bacterium]